MKRNLRIFIILLSAFILGCDHSPSLPEGNWRLESIRVLENDTLVASTQYEYDADGKLSSTQDFDINGERHETYRYDRFNRITNIIYLNEDDGSISGYDEFSYKNENINSIDSYNSEEALNDKSSPRDSTKLFYNSNSKLEYIQTDFFNDGDIDGTTNYFYDSSNKLVSYEYYRGLWEDLTLITNLIYFDDGQLHKITLENGPQYKEYIYESKLVVNIITSFDGENRGRTAHLQWKEEKCKKSESLSQYFLMYIYLTNISEYCIDI